MNLGQLSMLLRARFDADIQPVTKVSGMAFRADELHEALLEEVAGTFLPQRMRRPEPRSRPS